MAIRKPDVAPIQQKPRIRPAGAEQKPAAPQAPEQAAEARPTTEAKATTATPQALQKELEESAVLARELAQGLEKTTSSVSGEQASQTRLEAQQRIRDSHAGRALPKNELRPEFKAAQELLGALFPEAGAKLEQRLEEKAPGLKAAKDAMAPHLSKLAADTMAELSKNPEAMKTVTAAMNAVGKEGFQQALEKALPELSHAFTAASGVSMMNPEAVQLALENIPSLVAKVTPAKAEAAKTLAASLGKKLGVAEKLAEGAAKTAASQTAHAAAHAGAAGAAKTGGKAIPVVGNAIALGSTIYAAAGFAKQLFTRPLDAEKVCKEGLNTLCQGAGIAFPWIALGGDLVNMGWSAKIASKEAKNGAPAEKPVVDTARLKDAMPLVQGGLEALETALQAAESGKGAERVRALREQAGQLLASAEKLAAHEGPAPGEDLAAFKKKQEAFLSSFSTVAHEELQGAAQETSGPERESLLKLAEGFGKLFQVAQKNRVFEKRGKMPGAEAAASEEKAKRGEMGGELVKILSDMATAAAALAAARKGPAQA